MITSAVSVVTPPSAFLTLEEAKMHLRLDHTASDDWINQIGIPAVCGVLDGPWGWLGRAVGPQVLRMTTDVFPTDDPLWLPVPQVTAISSVTYYDSAGVSQTLANTVYALQGLGTDRVGLILALNQAWPTVFGRDDAVTVNFSAGYTSIPPALKAAALLMLGDFYESGQSFVVGVSATEIPMSMAVKNLLSTFRVYWV